LLDCATFAAIFCMVHYTNCNDLFLNWKFETLSFCQGWDGS